MCDRIDKYGEWEISIAENICFDDSDPLEIILGQLIDDGNKTRGHRLNIFNQEFQFLGVACGPHKNYRHCTVLNFAVRYKDKVSEEPEEPDEVYRRRTTIPEERTVLTKNDSFQSPGFFKKEEVITEGGMPKKHNPPKSDITLQNVEMPEGALSCKVKKLIKTVGNIRITRIIKIFKMKDGSVETQEEVEEEYV